jgi:hypothetical protein
VDADNWVDNVQIRRKALAFQPENLNLQAYLLIDLDSAIHSHTQPQDRLDQYQSIRSGLESHCEKSGALNNCQPFLLFLLNEDFNHKNWTAAKRHLELYRESSSVLDPLPRSVNKLEFLYHLEMGENARAQAMNWLNSNHYFPNPEYRMLRIISECLSGSAATAKEHLQIYRLENLITQEQLNYYIYSQLEKNLAASVHTCLDAR